MESFHCNTCGHLPHLAGMDRRRYFITSCGHILCGNCSSNKDICLVCKLSCRFVEVSESSSSEIKSYFMDPMPMLADQLKKCAKICNFQKGQAKSLQGLISRLFEAYKKAASENVSLKNNLDFSQKEAADLKLKIQALEQEQQHLIGGGIKGLSSEHSFQLGMSSHQYNQPQFISTPEVRSYQLFDTPSSEMRTPFQMQTPNSYAHSPASSLNFGAPSSLGSTGCGANSAGPSPSPIHFGGGRLILNRTTNATPRRRERSVSPFCAAPGAERARNQAPDHLVTRLQNLRCSTITPVPFSSTPNNK